MDKFRETLMEPRAKRRQQQKVIPGNSDSKPLAAAVMLNPTPPAPALLKGRGRRFVIGTGGTTFAKPQLCHTSTTAYITLKS
jgi:hypothetical protein